MPAVRLSARRGSAIGRRRSLLVASFAKPGTYGYTPPTSPQAQVTFAPNVTPVSYSAPSPTPSPFGSPSLTTDLPLPLFPPSATPAPPPTRRRVPPGKRRSQGYVPRPPNAFMLFRADFVRQKHVPGSIETNHGSLSKIIGNCWRALPLPEKHIWETKAKHAKAEHKLKYPDYKFRPVHNKRGAAASTSTANPAPPTVQPPSRSASGSTVKGQLTPQEDERRCEEVAALLLQGKKGEELAWAVRDLDSRRNAELSHSSPSPAPLPYHASSKFPHPLNLDPMYYPQAPSSPPASSLASSHPSGSGAGSPYSLPMPLEHNSRDQTWRHRRSSSVPLPNDYSYTFPPFMYGEGNGMGITLPSLDFPSQSQSQAFSLPPPPSSEDSLAGLPPSISGPGRMSFSWSGTGSSLSYQRPFSFGAGMGGGGRGSFSFAGVFGGSWGNTGNGPVGRRASSAQAFFSPSSFPNYASAGPQAQEQPEELPDADTSLFEVGFLHSFGASASGAGSPASDAVSPFDGAGEQTMLHAPQPVHAVSPLGVEFAEQQQQQAQQEYEAEQQMFDAYPADAGYASHHSTPASYGEVDSYAGEAQQQAGEQEQTHEQQHGAPQSEAYPPFEFPCDDEHPLGFASELRASTPATYDMDASAYDNYASEFV
ncbi:hypothetical protein DFH07DRAFT_1054566 [Mycena maculata]|uniref:HMG box domain-containing protein n=1 Tax=Mycena maculata TaxID=230809 RepID=A0AAD7KGN2_9AGAR|nr:hypothetical protein DFH07DRAFT_1054566 [Mycena maculata]